MQSPELVDYIGVESCVDLRPDAFDGPPYSGGGGVILRPPPRRLREAVKKEYPPPIQWLTTAENLHAPLVMKKYHTDDGRLVIKEEKAERCDFFRAHRSNGRLVLNFISFDDTDEESDGIEQTEVELSENIGVSDEIIDGRDVGSVDPTVDKAFSNCFKLTTVAVRGVNPCGGYGVAVPLHS